MTKTVNVTSISGGKDSTAMWIYGMYEQKADLYPVFADTGHEHPETYKYLDYLESQLGPIKRVKADFTARIAKKRQYVQEHWPRKLTADIPGYWWSDLEDPGEAPTAEPDDKLSEHKNGHWTWLPAQKGMTDSEAAAVVKRALSVLYPTGIPFLDLCIWKGRFPSTKARFCTEFLKIRVIEEQVYDPFLSEGWDIVSWQGVRADESLARSKLEMHEAGEGFSIYRPLIHWTVDDVFEIHRKYGIEPNPLYKLGMGRVGCMPCINCNKAELFEIARRFPEEIARVSEWEQIVKMASKRQAATFFPTAHNMPDGIDGWVEWSKTVRGGASVRSLESNRIR